MVEFLVRLALISGVIGVGFVSGHPSPYACGFAALWALVWGGTVQHFDQRGILTRWAGVVASVDGVSLAATLALAHQTDTLGFVVLAPVLWASRKYGISPVNIVPIVATALVGTSLLLVKPTLEIGAMVSALGVLGVGLLIGRPRVLLMKSDRRSLVPEEEFEPIPAPQPLFTKTVVQHDPDNEELKENYRALKDHAYELEHRNRRDRTALHLHEAVAIGRELPFASLAKALFELGGASFASLFVAAPLERRLLPEAHYGETPDAVKHSQFSFDHKDEDKLRGNIERKLDQWESAEENVFCAILLRAHDRIVGLVVLGDPNERNVHAAQTRVEEVAGVVAQLVATAQEREVQKRRLAEAEVLYTVAAVTLGSESRTSVAARVLRELGPTLELDHIGVSVIDGTDAISLATEGNPCDLLPLMSFAYGPGVGGWQAVGSPELVIPDALDDPRIPKQAALKRRIGSFVAVPIQFSETPYGFISATTQRVNGIEPATVETLRIVAAEMSHAFARLENPHGDAEGLMTPKEFRTACNKCDGALIHIDVLRRKEIGEHYGLPALDMAVRKFAAKARTRLPQGGSLCRRDNGDYMFFLPLWEVETGSRWANDLIATYASVTILTPDGRLRIPLTMRAKVAAITPQPLATSRLDA